MVEPLPLLLLLVVMVILAVSAIRRPEHWGFLMTRKARRRYLAGVGALTAIGLFLEMTAGGATADDVVLILLLGAALAVARPASRALETQPLTSVALARRETRLSGPTARRSSLTTWFGPPTAA